MQGRILSADWFPAAEWSPAAGGNRPYEIHLTVAELWQLEAKSLFNVFF